jgi:hypothetical protein
VGFARISSILLCAVLAPATAYGHDVPPSRDAAIMTMSTYAKGLRADYFQSGGTVSDQIAIGMGVPDKPVKQNDGTWLVAGCRPKSCDEKSAIIATSGGEALAAAIVHYACAKKNSAEDCATRPILTIFVRSFVTSPDVPRNLQDWARREVAQYKGRHPLQIEKIRTLPR